MTDNPMLQAALRYLLQGLTPIPIEPKGKRPLNPWKVYQSRKPTVEEVETWWQVWPEANVGLVMGNGIFAIDVDGQRGAESLLLSGMEIPDDAPTSRTGRGRHIFLSSGGADIPDKVAWLPGVDIRGKGFVVVPPSLHENGTTYEWITPLTGVPPIAVRSLVDSIGGGGGRGATSSWVAVGNEWLVDALQSGKPEGTRDDLCTKIAGYFLGRDISPAATQAILEAWGSRCSPPFPPDQVAKCVDSIAVREGPKVTAGPFSLHLQSAYENIGKKRPVRPTGVKALDDMIGGGLHPAEFTILGARPGLGKTTFALQVARHVADLGFSVLFVSLEMSTEALARRILAQDSGVAAHILRSEVPSGGQWSDLEASKQRLMGLDISLTSEVQSIGQLKDMVEDPPGQYKMVVVDYLQLLHGSRGQKDRRLEVEEVSGALKRLALTHNIPVMALSSLSRPPHDFNEQNWRPNLSDLRESGALEHGADLVLMFSRAPDNWHRLSILKQRDGRTGEIPLRLSESLRFS